MYVYSTHMWNLERNDTNELTYKTETDSQTSRTSLWLPGEGWGEGIVRDAHVYTVVLKVDNQQGSTV